MDSPISLLTFTEGFAAALPTICHVCMNEITSSDTTATVHPCGGSEIHAKCLWQWIQRCWQPMCPGCRVVVAKVDVWYPQGGMRDVFKGVESFMRTMGSRNKRGWD